MEIGIATRIINKGVSDDIFNNIIDMTKLQEMLYKLCTTCSHVDQRVVYLLLQELSNYHRNNKPKRVEKPAMSIFANVRFLIKQLQDAITPDRDI